MSFLTIVTAFSIIGALSVALQHAGPANLLWSISNPILVYHNLRIGEYYQAVMFSVFAAFAVYGAVQYIRTHRKDPEDICFRKCAITGQICNKSGNCAECQQARTHFGVDLR